VTDNAGEELGNNALAYGGGNWLEVAKKGAEERNQAVNELFFIFLKKTGAFYSSVLQHVDC